LIACSYEQFVTRRLALNDLTQLPDPAIPEWPRWRFARNARQVQRKLAAKP
jgi:hypothetical protein